MSDMPKTKGVGMKRRALALVLAAALTLGVAPTAMYATDETGGGTETTESVATVDGQGYDTLAAAVEAVVNSEDKEGTVTLNKDASGSGIGLFNSKGATGVDLTIDFGTHTYTCADPAVGSSGTESQGFHLEKGNTVTLKNGAIKVASDSTKTKMLIQNYCNLNLENLELEGSSITQYIVSCNYGDMTLKNVDISGSYSNGLVAIDLMHWLSMSAYEDKAPTMTVENSSENTIVGSVDVYCYGTSSNSGVSADTCTDKPSLSILGGMYSVDVSQFIPDGYTCKQNSDTSTWTVSKLESGQMELEISTDSGVVSGTLDGVYSSANTDIDTGEQTGTETGVTDDGAVTVDLSTQDSPAGTAATLTIPAATASSLTSASSLTVKTDMGSVSFDGAALSKMGANGNQESTVTISVTKGSATGTKASYVVEAKAGEANLLPYGGTGNGTVTITVPKPADATNLQAWYVVENGADYIYVNKLAMSNADNNSVAISIDHLSTVALTDGDPSNQAAAAITDSNGNTTFKTSLEDAVSAVQSGDTITLLKDVVVDGTGKVNSQGILTFDEVENVTLDGNGKTITAKNVTKTGTNSPSMINVVNGASVTIKKLAINGAIDDEKMVKHGVNVWNGATATIEETVIKNCVGYAIVANSSSLTVNGLTTSDNGWGGINVDNSPNGTAEGTTVEINNATINEANSIKIEHSKNFDGDSSIVINSGSFKSIVDKTGSDEKLDLTITGGTFKPEGNLEGTIDISEYVADGLEWNPSTGEVKEDTPDTPDTPVTPSKPSYAVNVTKPENGSIAAKPAKAKEGDKVTITVTPDKGFELVELTVTDKDGKAVKATLNDDGTYTFTMPKGAVSIAATFDCDGGELCPTHPFTDVDQDKWYHDAVDWAVENGVMRGYDNTTLFGPEDSHTREQAATVMWNIMGEGDLEAPAADLADVIQTEWYAPYVNWAYEAGIMRGYTGTDDFGVGDALSREQFAQIIVNATKADLSSVDTSVLDDFEDPDSVSPWAEKTMAWAVENGIIHGVDDTKLQGDRSITRAEMATMVKNAVDEGIISLAK